MTEAGNSPTLVETVPPRRPRRFSWRSLLASAALFSVALVLSNPEHVLGELLSVNVVWLAPAFAVAVVQLMLLGLRWSRISRMLGVDLGFTRATLEYALSVALNLVLPSGFAGDGLRAYRHNRLAPGPGALRIVEALALDRISGQLALALVVLLGLPLGITAEILDLGALGIALSSLVVLVVLGVLVIRRVRRFAALMSSLGRLAARAARVLLSPRNLAWHLPLSLLFTAASVTQLYFASRALCVPLGVVQLAWAGPLVLLAASLPSFFGGWGVREGASGLIFAALGLAPASGVAVSVVYGVFGLVVHLPGLLVLGVDANPASATPPSEASR